LQAVSTIAQPAGVLLLPLRSEELVAMKPAALPPH
jgi:hypothetical protein